MPVRIHLERRDKAGAHVIISFMISTTLYHVLICIRRDITAHAHTHHLNIHNTPLQTCWRLKAQQIHSMMQHVTNGSVILFCESEKHHEK